MTHARFLSARPTLMWRWASFTQAPHPQSGNSYGVRLKEKHTKFPQPELGPWLRGPKTVGTY